ncbi:uncharacterized protein LOC131437874 isoform X2 [Malaya genurostris]|uniref:uncharacterized protein LOC131437874 isoform X2 n=1 Tax=Malaya genurostris TaxID=325434 RepID=UPI0026F3C372|nr:uncharacterized protein LOC131437874 isoform X2 [Malaya genurostris]
MLTTITLILVGSALQISAQTPPSRNDLPMQTQTLPTLLPTVPPDQLFTIVQPQSPPPVMNLPPSPGKGIQYEHSISLGPNSNYYVYYSDHVQNLEPQNYVQQQQQSQSSPIYQSFVGYSNDQSSQIIFNTNTVPVQLVTLLQPTLDAAVAQENGAVVSPPSVTGNQTNTNLNEEGIQKLVSSTQNLVSNEDVVSINNAEEDPTNDDDSKDLEKLPAKKEQNEPVDSEPSESRKNEERLTDNLAESSFTQPIIVGEMSDSVARNHRSGNGLENYQKQINVEIIGESDDHNKGQYLKETIFPVNQLTSEPCDDDLQSTPVLIKHEVTTIRPISLTTKGRGTTASRLSTRFRTTPVQPLSSTARYSTKETVTVTPKPVSNKYLAPIQAGLRLSNSQQNIDDCIDAILQPPKQDLSVEKKTLVEVQKSVNIKNFLIDQDKPAKQRELGTRTKIVQQPIFVEKPVEKIVKQNVYIEKPVDRIVQQPVYIEKPVPHPVDRIVEKKVPVPYPVEKIVEKPVQTVVQVPYAVEKQVPVHHYIDRPVTQPVPVPVPVERIVEKPYPVERVITKEVQVPYPVTQVVEKIVDRPYPVEKVVTKEVQVPYPVTHVVDRPYPVEVPVEKVVEKIVDRPVQTVVEKHVEVPVPVTVEKVVEKFIDRPVPYPVQVPVEVPVQVPVHYPVEVPVGVPIPYPVEKLIPVTIHEPKPTHSIIKTTTHEKLFDLHKFFGGKKKHFIEHIFIKPPHHPKPQLIETKHLHYHNQYPKNDLHFGASIQAPTYVDVAQFNVLPHHYPEKQKNIYGTTFLGDAFNGKYTYQTPLYHQQQPIGQQIYKDDYVGPTPLLEDHWAVKSDGKFRRSTVYGKSLRIEYGGFKPPLVPSVEIDENGNPLHKEQNAT